MTTSTLAMLLSEKKMTMIAIRQPIAPFLAGCLLLAGVPGRAHAQNGSATLPVVNGTPFTSGPVTVDGAHCGWNYVLGGGAFYTATFPSASAMPLGCAITVTNVDPMPSGSNATGAKWVAVDVAPACQARSGGIYLWPQQSMQVSVVSSGVWLATRCPDLWELPSGVVTINVDPINGSDTRGVADGLSTGTRAFASMIGAMNYAGELMRFNFKNHTQLQIKLCASCTDTLGIHWPPHGGEPLGAQGGAALTIDCNGGSLGGTPSMDLYFSAVVQAQNCTFLNGISVSEGGKYREFGSGGNTYCASSGQSVFTLALRGEIYLNSDSTICGGIAVNSVVSNNNSTFVNAATMTFSGALKVTQTVNGTELSYTNFGAVRGGSNVTGVKWSLIENSVLGNSANVPGTSAGRTCNTCVAD
jgi:hypothetical protein